MLNAEIKSTLAMYKILVLCMCMYQSHINKNNINLFANNMVDAQNQFRQRL